MNPASDAAPAAPGLPRAGLAERLYRLCGGHYILLMMVGTRIFGSVGGMLVIYYVELALTLPDVIRSHFRVAAAVVVVVGCTLTVLMALWETRTLREVLRRIFSQAEVPREQLAAAAREAVVFVGRHHRHESWMVPCSTLIPVLIYLKVWDDASFIVLLNITLAVFMGITMALMSTFFAVDHFLQPVIRDLLSRGAALDFDDVPRGRLRFRFGFCFTLIIVTTALMISTLAIQRASEIVNSPGDQGVALRSLLTHCVYITIAAVITGVVYSQLLSYSVASRASALVKAMERVGAGSLSARLQPTGNDEIDRLGRQFNTMVARLEHNHQTIQDLNANLEGKVRRRTQELEETLQTLRDTQSQMTDLAHRAGMAEIATGVLHNVGNVLNSLNVSAACLEDRLRRSKLNELKRLTGQLEDRRGRLGEFFADDGRGEKVLEYLTAVCKKMEAEQKECEEELRCVTEKIGLIRGIISTQQNYARRVRFREWVDVARLIEEVLGLDGPLIAKHRVKVVTDFRERPSICVEKSNLVQVIENVVKNAVESMAETSAAQRVLTVRLASPNPDRLRITISDTGRGMDRDHLSKIFTYGFTTKPNGSGFGLHASALAVSAIGGAIHAESEGVGRGATFTIELPLAADSDTEAGGLAESGQTEAAESLAL